MSFLILSSASLYPLSIKNPAIIISVKIKLYRTELTNFHTDNELQAILPVLLING